MKSSCLLFVILALLLCSSCGKNGCVVAPTLDYSSAIQLKVGNSWIYSDTIVDIGNNIKTAEANDTVVIKKDTLINGLTFYKISSSTPGFALERKTPTSIIDIDGQTIFSSTDFTDTLVHDQGAAGFMQRLNETVTVPAGTFVTIAYVVIYKTVPDGANGVVGPDNPSVFNSKFSIETKVWYAPNVGVVKSVTYYGNFTAFERKLIRYNVTP